MPDSVRGREGDFRFSCFNLLGCVDEYSREFLKRLGKPSPHGQRGEQGNEQGGQTDTIKSIKDKLRKSLIKHLMSIYGASSDKCSELKSVAEDFNRELVNALISLGFLTVVVNAGLRYAGLVGSGSGLLASVFEVGVQWDLLRDVPFIPGSAIKGAMRSLLLTKCAELGKDAVLRCVESVSRLLGYTRGSLRRELRELGLEESIIEKVLSGLRDKSAESLVFIADSYPVKCGEGGLIQGWVITPHYGYSEDLIDEYSVQPNPILHAVISQGTEFSIVFGVREEGIKQLRILGETLGLLDEDNPLSASIVTKVFLPIINAVLENGVGARTSKGYTKFQVYSLKIIIPREVSG